MIGFWSYTRADARSARGRLDDLRGLVADELRLLMGSRPGIELWHDTSSIPYGKEWERVIQAAIKRSSFFIPVVTPAFLQSEWCCKEVLLFLAHQESLGRSGLIFPVFYVDVGGVDPSDPDRCHDPKVLELLRHFRECSSPRYATRTSTAGGYCWKSRDSRARSFRHDLQF
jgi:hypothetical protein